MDRARAEAEARVRDKTYYFQKAAAEAAAKIRYKVGGYRGKIERSEDEADIKEKAENMRKAREEMVKAESETA